MLTEEEKRRIADILTECVIASDYEWRVTEDYVYIGCNGVGFITQNLLNKIREVKDWETNVIGQNGLVLEYRSAIPCFYYPPNDMDMSLHVGIKGYGKKTLT